MRYYKNSKADVFGFETQEEREKFGTSDMVELTAAELEAWSNPAKGDDQTVQEYTATALSTLDAFAVSRGYASIADACTYALSKNAKRRREGARCVDLRDTYLDAVNDAVDKFKKGTGNGKKDALKVKLPDLTWDD